jgi:hypothetical protein
VSHLIGRVVEVVTSDAELGPHLLVVLQRFNGAPPQAVDATTITRVYHPIPGRPVSDYAVGEYVSLVHFGSARLVVKLG